MNSSRKSRSASGCHAERLRARPASKRIVEVVATMIDFEQEFEAREVA